MSDAESLYLAEVTVYDPWLPVERTLYYSTGKGYTTSPSETPASQYFDARIKQPAVLRRDMFAAGTTQGRTRICFGDLILINDDGGLDGLLEYSFDGRAITIRQGEPGAAYPSGFTTVFVGTMQGCTVDGSTVT